MDKPRWRDTPVALTGLSSARRWWKAEYDRHIAAGFSDADARPMITHLAMHLPGPHRLMIAQQQERM